MTTETPESAKVTPEKGQRFGLLLVKSLFTTEPQSNPEVWFRVRKQLSLASKTDGNRVGQDRLAKEQASSDQLGPLNSDRIPAGACGEVETEFSALRYQQLQPPLQQLTQRGFWSPAQ